MGAWNGWYLVTGNTYGTRLPGDDRGWVTRHGRPQPGTSQVDPIGGVESLRLLNHSKKLMTRDVVVLSWEARGRALELILGALRHHEKEVIVATVTAKHFHVLARFRDGEPRKWAGIAKKESARALAREGLVAAGGVWAVRTHCEKILDREHQVKVARYVAAHVDEGGVVWACWGDSSAKKNPGTAVPGF